MKTTNNDINRIVLWGPKGSGKTWLFRAFLKDIEILSDKLKPLGYPVVVEEQKNINQRNDWVKVGHVEGLEYIATPGLTQALYRVQRKRESSENSKDKFHGRFLSNRVNSQSHEIVVIDNAGGLFEEGNKTVLNSKEIEQAEDEVRNAHYLILALNSGNAITGQGTLVDDLKKLAKTLNGSSGKSIAACITKVDTLGQELIISLYNQNENELRSLLTRSFGRQYANEVETALKTLRNDHDVKIFATSATGHYINPEGKKAPNTGSNTLADNTQWNPEEVEKPFFWLFDKIERERIKYISNNGKLFRILMKDDTILSVREEAYHSYDLLIRLADAQKTR